jgi:hypothetical protein
MIRMDKIRVVLLAGAAMAAFTPLLVRSGGGLANVSAVCGTCCPQSGATCVICGSSTCTTETGYYEGKIGGGACVSQT